MTLEEVAKLIKLNRSNYPNAYKDSTAEELKALAKSWHVAFRAFSAEEVVAAYHAALTYCRFPVTVADIFDVFRAQTKKQQVPAEQLWQELRKALQRVPELEYRLQFTNNSSSKKYPGKSQAHEARQDLRDLLLALPPEVMEWVGNVNRMIDLSRMPAEQMETVVFSQFRRGIEQRRELDAAANPLPQIGSAQKMAELEEGGSGE